MILAALLSTLIGLSLGLLGGGGSILTVPILTYALGVPAKSAIATSLLVVGVTSSFAAIAHARAGRVLWRTAGLFGASGMVGAFAGGWLAHLVPATVLLVGFGAVMLATAVAMMRSKKGTPEAAPRRNMPIGRVLVDGLVVGLVTGMVGAGGGFLVVPALVLLGGLSMDFAIGTSLVVIAMKSFAGFAGHLGHVSIDVRLTLVVTAAAVAGSIAGSLLARKAPQALLREAFSWFVVVMAVYLLVRQLPDGVRESSLYRAVLVDRWPWYVGGGALAAFVLAFLWYDNKLLGVSTGCAELCALRRDPAVRSSWRLRFLGGLVLGGVVGGRRAGASPTFGHGRFDLLFGASLAVKLPVLLGAGVLIGYGARAAGGCTSGHSIVGSALGGRASLLSTAAFMVAGFATTQLLVALV